MKLTEAYDLKEFSRNIGDIGALIGLDPGTKTIGVAISDINRTLASPVTTIQRGKFAVDAATLSTLCDAEQIKGLVIGMPYNMDGTSGPRAQSVRAFRRQLAEYINLPMVFWDERLSSSAAQDALIDAGQSVAQRQSKVDASAAAEILRDCMIQMRTQLTITNR